MRVLKTDGVLIFKWSEYDIPATEVWKSIGNKPLFGHHSGKSSKTFWALNRMNSEGYSDNTAEKAMREYNRMPSKKKANISGFNNAPERIYSNMDELTRGLIE